MKTVLIKIDAGRLRAVPDAARGRGGVMANVKTTEERCYLKAQLQHHAGMWPVPPKEGDYATVSTERRGALRAEARDIAKAILATEAT
jgi:hypothetical protein